MCKLCGKSPEASCLRCLPGACFQGLLRSRIMQTAAACPAGGAAAACSSILLPAQRCSHPWPGWPSRSPQSPPSAAMPHYSDALLHALACALWRQAGPKPEHRMLGPVPGPTGRDPLCAPFEQSPRTGPAAGSTPRHSTRTGAAAARLWHPCTPARLRGQDLL